MDTKKKNVVDVSRFFIFEATGDSEADRFDDDPNNKATTTNDRDAKDVNDAESCSRFDVDDDGSDVDGDDSCSDDNYNNEVNGRFHENVQVCIDGDKEEEGEEVHSYYPTWHHHEPHNNNNNNNGHNKDSSDEELLSETEKNKLFWETCLES